MGAKPDGRSRNGGRREGAGRPRGSGLAKVGSYAFRRDARRLTALYAGRADIALKALGDKAQENPEAFLAAWLKVAEHGFGRPPQHLSLEHTGDGGGPVEYRVVVEGGAALPAAATGIPGRPRLLGSAS